jgi:geranylgeranyl pyrophosphate synthase
MKLENFVETCHQRIRNLFESYLITISSPSKLLQEAMIYGVTNGGKQIRPLLVYATGYALETNFEKLDAPAVAVELIHAYSLIHDDLPAMDNSDLRRGKPACHKAFNEWTAILAGDTLQPLAFEIIAAHPSELSPQQRIEMIKVLAHASGMNGMAGGQALDLENTDDLLTLYKLKTGALLKASIELGAIAGKASPEVMQSLQNFAENIGLAFQPQDDLLDYENSQETGKPQNIDVANNKKTYSMMHGVKKTHEAIEDLYANAFSVIKPLGNSFDLLKALATSLLQRKK